jgi:hypothetical protein
MWWESRELRARSGGGGAVVSAMLRRSQGPWLSRITPMSTNRYTTPETSMPSSQIDSLAIAYHKSSKRYAIRVSWLGHIILHFPSSYFRQCQTQVMCFWREFLASRLILVVPSDQPGAQEKFLEIKNAYQTLVDSQSRSEYDASRRTRSNDWDPFQWSGSSRKSTQEEEFYGVGTFHCKPPLFLSVSFFFIFRRLFM